MGSAAGLRDREDKKDNGGQDFTKLTTGFTWKTKKGWKEVKAFELGWPGEQPLPETGDQPGGPGWREDG